MPEEGWSGLELTDTLRHSEMTTNACIVNSAIPKNTQKATQFGLSVFNGDQTGLNGYVLSNFGAGTHTVSSRFC